MTRYYFEKRARQARYLATDAQRAYLRSLLNEAFAKHYTHRLCMDPHHLDRVTREDASVAIDTLKAAKARGWKAAP